MDSTAGWALFAQIAPRLSLAELASEQGGLGQQCGVDLLLAKILWEGNKKSERKDGGGEM